MRTRWAATLALLVIPLANPALGETESGGVSSPLQLGVGGRALAMGRAGSALSVQSDALFWNPGRLGWMHRGDLSLLHSDAYVEDARLQALHLGYPTLDLGSFAIGLQHLRVGSIDRRDPRNVPIGDITSSETHALVGYGRRMTSWLAGGATIRVAQQSIGDAKDTSFGLDLGLAAEGAWDEDGRHGWAVALQLQNAVAPKIQLDDAEVIDPLNARVGLGYRGLTSGGRLEWALAADVELPERGPKRWGAGLEVGVYRSIYLRGGLDDGDPTLGVGLGHRGVSVDYVSAHDGDLPRNDRIALSTALGRDRDSRLNARRLAQQREVAAQLESLLAERESKQGREATVQARAALESGDLERVVQEYRRVLLIEPTNEEALAGVDRAERELANARAEQALNERSFALAAALYQQVLERWPDDATALAGHEHAREQLSRAKNREQQLDSLFGSALAAFGDGRLLDAQRLLEELLGSEPTHSFGLELSARLDSALNERFEETLRSARGLHERGEVSRARELLAQAQGYVPSRSSEIDDLRVQWRRAAQEASVPPPKPTKNPAAPPAPAPADPRLLQRLFDDGLEAFENRNFDGATELWQRVWVLDPDYAGVGEYLVNAYLLQSIQYYGAGDYSKALSRCEHILEIDPTHEKATRYASRIREEQSRLTDVRSAAGR